MSSRPPNILLVTTDQQRTDTLGCYGAAHVRTPNIDRLAQQGVRFDRAYTVNPVCTPARVSLFTGLMPSRHGAWNVGMNYDASEVTLAHDLRRAGYRTHYVGKTHFQAFMAEHDQSIESVDDWERRYPGFTGPYYGLETVELSLGHTIWGVRGHYGAWVRDQLGDAFEAKMRSTPAQPESFGGEALDWELPTRLHSSVWTTDRTIAFLEQHDRSKPFLLAVGFQDPHHPHAVPKDYDDRVDPKNVPPPDFTPGELDDKPPQFLDNHEGRIEKSWSRGEYPVAGTTPGFDYRGIPDSAACIGRAYYYTLCQLIDREMGRILATLDRLGLADDTIVIFTSDHGELLGDHGMWMKGPFLYEQLVRIPLVIRWPRGARAGTTTEALYSHVDLVPTLLAAAGVAPSARLDGVDLRTVLSGERDSVRDHVIVECVDDPTTLRSKCVITRDRKLTWYCNQAFGELYDLEKDPREKINRWSDPEYARDRAELLSRILASLEPLENRSQRLCYA